MSMQHSHSAFSLRAFLRTSMWGTFWVGKERVYNFNTQSCWEPVGRPICSRLGQIGPSSLGSYGNAPIFHVGLSIAKVDHSGA